MEFINLLMTSTMKNSHSIWNLIVLGLKMAMLQPFWPSMLKRISMVLELHSVINILWGMIRRSLERKQRFHINVNPFISALALNMTLDYWTLHFPWNLLWFLTSIHFWGTGIMKESLWTYPSKSMMRNMSLNWYWIQGLTQSTVSWILHVLDTIKSWLNWRNWRMSTKQI